MSLQSAPALTNVQPSEVSVPRVPLAGGKRQDHVANVANMVLAHSLLRSFPEVDAARTVYMGLSWGSWYGSCVTAVDDRFKGACMIYLCDRHPNAKANPSGQSFVKGPFHKSMKVPSWWIVWPKDANGNPSTFQAGWEACPCESGRTIVHNLGHSHEGFSVAAVHRMARYFAGDDVRLPLLSLGCCDGRTVSAEIVDPGKGVAKALLWYTRQPPPKKAASRKNMEVEWLSAPAAIRGGTVSADVPADARIVYLSAYENDQPDRRRNVLCGSSGFFHVLRSEAEELAREDAHTQGKTVIAGKGDVQIALDRADAQYKCGEEAVFTITAGEKTSGKVSWTLDNYGAHVFAKGTVDLAKENPFTVKGTLPYPGFLRVTVRGDRGRQLRQYSAAYEPEKIRTAVPRPGDFDAFWENAVARLEKEVPLDPQVEQVPGWPKKGVNLQRVSFATVGGKRVYGVLAAPTDATKGPYPVRIHFPGAGAGLVMKRCHGDPDHVTLYMGSHYFPIPETDEDAKAPYESQEAEWRRIHGPSRARAYPVGGLTVSREAAHYYGIILGVNRAIDWVAQRTDIDPKRFFYTGASQGGGFGLILTALNGHITRAYAGVPAMADMLGCKADGRQSGWPRILEYETQTDPARLAKIEENVRYFDAAFFAARIRVPIRLSVGYADESCAPHSVLAAYNAIPSKDKKLYHGIGGLHGSRNAPREEVDKWLEEK